MKHIFFLLPFVIITFSSCSRTPKNATENSPIIQKIKTNPNPKIDESEENKKLIEDFFNSNLNEKMWLGTESQKSTLHYDLKFSTAIQIIDYPKSGEFGDSPSLRFQLELPTKLFFSKLPQSIVEKLDQYSISNNEVQIHFNYRSMEYIGENEDHLGENNFTTRLRAHAWVDPDFDGKPFKGDRFNRNIKYGVFDHSNPEIFKNSEVPNENLKDFNVHIHDNVWSPRNTGINIGDKETTLAFWALAIDEKEKKANATLIFLDPNFSTNTGRNDYNCCPYFTSEIIQVGKLGDYLQFIIENLKANNSADDLAISKLENLFSK